MAETLRGQRRPNPFTETRTAFVMATPSETTQCCVVGGGPAGIILAYLLARSGIRVILLEKHADFLRDFRGDTIHPSTMQLLDELGLIDEFLPLVDFRADQLHVNVNGRDFLGPTLKHLKTKYPFLGLVPQWEFLNLISSAGRRFPEFDLRMSTKATGVVRADGRVVGVRYEGPGGPGEILADLVVAADGRNSTLRLSTHHVVEEQGIPIDVLWFRLDRPQTHVDQTLGWLRDGHMLVTIPRRDHYQTAMIIQKGAFDAIQQEGIETFRRTVSDVCPQLAGVVSGLRDWSQVKLLTVQLNRLPKWHEPGLLFIGDAAHAMSPIGGVGINLAIQDAVASANILTAPLQSRSLSEERLAAVQRRREPAARKTQRFQAAAHALLFGRGVAPGRPFSPPWYLRFAIRPLLPILRPMIGRWVGIGFQPEHIETQDVH